MIERLGAELVLDTAALLGECPVWDARDGVLVWLDLLGQRLHRFDPAGGADTAVALAERVGAVAPRAAGGWVAATPQGFASVAADGTLTTLVEVEADRPGNRMNDGRCDAAGRFWAGTMAESHAPGAGALYRLDADRSVTRVVDGVGISNGIDWSPDGTVMYFVDSLLRTVSRFDVDAVRGDVEHRQTLIAVGQEDGVPDGLCVDADGFLWLALPRSGRVRRYAPDGRLVAEVELPVRLVTSVAFGGDDLGDLYMTTGAGGLFRTRPGSRGRPVNAWAG